MTTADARRVALVTGGGRNLGRAVAMSLAKSGHAVVITSSTDSADAHATADTINTGGGCAWVQRCDVSDPRDVAALRERCLRDGGRVGVVVNNAAARPESPFLQIGWEEWRAVLGVIVDGAYRLCQAFIPSMIETGRGRIINIIGVRGQQGDAGRAHVVTAKHGLIGLTLALACEYGTAGITVNGVSPGTIQRDDELAGQGRLARRESYGVLGRPGVAAEVAAMVDFLASDAAAYITGQIIGVNGGELRG